MAWYDERPVLVHDDGRVSRRRVYYMIDGSREEAERHMLLERMEAAEEFELREARAARDVLRMLGQE